MNVFSRLIVALNQSFRLLFVSIYRGFEFIFRSIKKVVIHLGRLIKKLHDALTTIIQLAINISSVVFVLFIPFGFFFDPLDWSRHLTNVLSKDVIFWGRMVLAGFFALVAYFLIAGLIKSWQESAAITEGGDRLASSDFVRGIAALVSWLVLLSFFIYFTVFRLQLLPIDLRNIALPAWLRALMSS